MLKRPSSESHTLRVTPGTPLRIVREALRNVDGHLPGQARDSLALMLTEAVANATRHGKPPMTAEVTWLAGTARIVVRSTGRPFRWRGRPAKPAEDGGWGLMLIDAMADRWGSDSSSGQNAVWFELDH